MSYSEAHRYRRICSDDRQFNDKVNKLTGWLQEWGYEEPLVNKQIDRVRKLDRETLLANADKEMTSVRGRESL